MHSHTKTTTDGSLLDNAFRKTILALIFVVCGLCSGKGMTQELTVLSSKPVQVHRFGPIRDHHPERENDYRDSRVSSAKFGPENAIQATESPLMLAPPLRGGRSSTAGIAFSISNYVDHNEAFPDQLSDWECGDRTYDTETFNHNGTDYQSTQFPWLTMANDGLITVAAADGIIVNKHDGEPDQRCEFVDGAEANYVNIQHDDGSQTLYAHLKTGSVTPRRVGDRVEQGDYLGVIGSSGISTGPHLHLGLRDSTRRLIDPYAGACNLTTDNTWWQEQEPYAVKGVTAVTTHSAAPQYPPCPQQEVPNFKDIFAPTDIIFLSVTVRDFEDVDTIDVQLAAPGNQVLWEQTYSQDEFAFAPNLSVSWGLQFSAALPQGQYTWRATFAGKSRTHIFHVGDGPAPEPEAVEGNNAFTGLWYDTQLDGEGYNVVTADAGTLFYFYGNDNRGNRLWLISDVVPGPVAAGSRIDVRVYESSGGIFSTPVQSSRGLSAWGTLTIRFDDCESGEATLRGVDGEKTSQIVKLVGISGATCTEGPVLADAGWSGLWFDAAKDGEGYNLLVTPVGRILYFYGFKRDGLRLWLISDVMSEALQVGTAVETTVYEATQGTFPSPVPSGESLVTWGTAAITLIDCNQIKIVLTGSDGSKTSDTVRLAGIIGVSCNN